MTGFAERFEAKDELDHALIQLTPREERVIRMSFGLNSEGAYTDEEIVEAERISKDRVKQIRAKALRKLRHPKRSTHLRGLMGVCVK